MYQLTEDENIVFNVETDTRVARGTWLWEVYQEWLGAGGKPSTYITSTPESPPESSPPSLQNVLFELETMRERLAALEAARE